MKLLPVLLLAFVLSLGVACSSEAKPSRPPYHEPTLDPWDAEYVVVQYLLGLEPDPDGFLAQGSGSPKTFAKYYNRYGSNNQWYNDWEGYRWKITYGWGPYYHFYVYEPNTVVFDSVFGSELINGKVICATETRKRAKADGINSYPKGRSDC